MLLDGRKVRDEIISKIKKKIVSEKLSITLAIIYIGNYEPSAVYVKNKIKYCAEVGIKTKLIRLETASLEQVIEIIDELNDDRSITGILLQRPVPNNIDVEECISHILPSKDVDGFTSDNFYKLAHNMDCLRPCTSKGIIRIFDYYNISLKGKNICVIGRGNLVGIPLIFELLKRDATVTVCHTKTQDLKEITLRSDIVVCGAGSPKLLTADMVKDGVIVVDAGISIIDGKIVGDVDFENLVNKCKYITPNPGGVGPMTIAMMLENMIEAKKGGV